EHFFGVAQKELEKREFTGLELYLDTFSCHFMRVDVDSQPACFYDLVVVLRLTPNHSSHTGEQLFHVERLGDVIVGSQIEPIRDVCGVILPCQNEDGHSSSKRTITLEHIQP